MKHQYLKGPMLAVAFLTGLLIITAIAAQAQNTNLGTNAGNTGSQNTSIGYFAGDVVTGTGNVFLGGNAGLNTGMAHFNSFIGYSAGLKNKTGQSNTFTGANSGYFNSASENSFYGSEAGYNNTTGALNSFFGSRAGYSNSTGGHNTLFGFQAGFNNTTGGSNTFIGSESGHANISGGSNTFLGTLSGRSNSTGNNNTFVGHATGYSNVNGDGNTSLGSGAGSSNTTGGNNTYVGMSAGLSITNGMSNTILGYTAGLLNTSGNRNVFVGNAAGITNTGSDNVFIGNEAGSFMSVSGKLVIHNTSSAQPLLYGDFASYQLGIGTTALGTYTLSVNGDAFATGMWLSSDRRFKENEKPLTGALEKLTNVQGVSYRFKKDETARARNFSAGDQLGFIAQDLQKTFPELVKENSDGYLAVNYSGMIPVLVEAIKELKAEVNSLKMQPGNPTDEKDAHLKVELGGPSLEQNHPNPFSQETLIRYTLPDGISSSLHIFDLTGKQIKVFENLRTGKNEVSISAASLSPGLYHYCLVVNGEIVATKKMLLTN